LVAANLGARWLLGLGALAATVVVLGLTLSLRASNTSVKLAELRSDFVSAVTHEFKTPVATIRAVGETMLSGRIDCTPLQRDYARLVVQESKRLMRFVDNLLAFSRVTDLEDAYRLERVSLLPLIEETLQEFKFQLADEGFAVTVDVAPDLPPVVGDRDAIGLVLSNLVDNVLRHSGKERWLGIRARASGQSIELRVSDKGVGIPKDEVGSVTRKFFRGRNAASGGSGLGLAIVQRIAVAHGGTVTLQSSPDVGTTVSVVFAQSSRE
jgi:two-component system phosphate regulon sensor histidine kinase PhoR